VPTKETDTRQSILDTAQRIMARKGFAALGLNEMLAEAGVPKGSFYHYFASKDAFGEALVKSYFNAYFTTFDRISTEPRKTSAERLMTYWQAFYDLQSSDDCQGRCLVVKLGAEVSDLSESMRLALKEGTAEIVTRIEQMIVAGLEDGSLSIDDTPAAVADALYDAWLGASVMAKINRGQAPLDRAMTITRQRLHL
jgi:TetR/AcrR family transcriptional repressor of nem operon